jgi:signal peptidase II
VLALVTALLVLIVDQASKYAVVSYVGFADRIDVLGSSVRLTHIRNPGAVFGIMKGAATYFAFFSAVAALVLLVVLFFARRASVMTRISLGMVLGGAVGNLIDRIRYGAVVDFIDIGISSQVRWPSFNVADVAITLGVIMLIVTTLKRPGEQPA